MDYNAIILYSQNYNISELIIIYTLGVALLWFIYTLIMFTILYMVKGMIHWIKKFRLLIFKL